MVRSAVGNGDDVENVLPLLLRARLQRDEVELDEALLELRLRHVASDLVEALLVLLEEDALGTCRPPRLAPEQTPWRAGREAAGPSLPSPATSSYRRAR